MEQAFGTVLFVVVGLSAVIALVTALGSGDLYRQIGRGGLSLDREDPTAGSASTSAERTEEIRQMLNARNERRRRRGQPPVDVEAELAQLEAPAVDPALRDEVRRHVVARNERRVRAGKVPLDVDAEISRRLQELT